MKLSVYGFNFQNQLEDPDFCELIVDDLYIGTFHLSDPRNGLDQFIENIYEDTLEFIGVEGRFHYYRSVQS